MDPDLKFRNQQHDGRNAVIGGIAGAAVIPVMLALGDYAPYAVLACVVVGAAYLIRKHK